MTKTLLHKFSQTGMMFFDSIQSAYDKIWKMLCGVYDPIALLKKFGSKEFVE